MPTYDQLSWQVKQFGNQTNDKLTDSLANPPAEMVTAQNVAVDTASYSVAAKTAGQPYGASGGFDFKATGASVTLATAGYDVVKTNKLTSAPVEIPRRDQALYSLIKKDESLVPKAAGGTLTTAANGGVGGYEYKAATVNAGTTGFEITKTAAVSAAQPTAAALQALQLAHRDAVRERADSVSNR